MMTLTKIAAGVLGWALVLAFGLQAQVPAPRPSPAPRVSPPSRGNTPTPKPPSTRGPAVSSPGQKPPVTPSRPISKKELEERRGGDSNDPTPSAPPAVGPTGPGAGEAEAEPRKAEPSPAELKSAEKRLAAWSRSLRPARREHWVGKVVFLDEARHGKSLAIEMWLERLEGGDLNLRFQYARLGDLPHVQVLSRAGAEGKRQWWRFRPEEGAECKPDDGRSGPVRDLLGDLIPIEPDDRHELRYLDADLMDARRILLFGYHAIYPAIVSFRPDLNLVTRVEVLDEKHEKALRELRFSEPERRGLYRRFTRIMRHDYESGDSLRIEWEAPDINPDLPDDFFDIVKLKTDPHARPAAPSTKEGDGD